MQQAVSRSSHICQVLLQHLSHQMSDSVIHFLQTAQGIDDVLEDFSPHHSTQSNMLRLQR